MATNRNITQITAPRVDLIDPQTGLVSREWYRFFYNLYVITGDGTGITAVVNGGTGLVTIPTNGQLLIGNGTGYTLNTLGFGAGISVTNGSGTISVANTGVLSNVAGTGISVSSATGNVTIANTGVLSFSAGTTGLTPATATTGAVTLAGTLAIANGGTNGSATPTAYGIAYGTGTSYAFTAAGTAKQVLIANTSAAPTWSTLTTGASILYGDGTGGFSNVTIGSGVSFVAGTLSATGTGGTVTSVTGTAPVVSSGGTTPAISMAAANGSTNGYLTSTDWTTFNNKGSGSVTSVSFTGGILSVATPTTTPALTVAGTSGGIPYFSSGTTWASSAALTQYGVVYGGGAGASPVATAAGTTGQVLTANTGSAPTWVTPASGGSVTSVSVVSANGFAGTVATSTTTPAITLTTSITGLLKGNGTAISAAVANTDYQGVAAPVTKTADFTVANGDIWHINNKSGSTCTVTLPAAASWSGRQLVFKNMQAQTLVSASSNVVPIDSTSAGTAILLGVVGNWATMVSDGTNWVIMQAAANNNLLLE